MKTTETKTADTFTINPACKLELVSSKDDTRLQIHNIKVGYSEKLHRNVAVATNGRSMAIVPVVVPEDQHGKNAKVKDCLLSPNALKSVRKIKTGPQGYFSVNGKIELTDGSALPVPTEEDNGPFVNWEQCLINEQREKFVFSIGLNPQLLLDLAKSIGAERGVHIQFTGALEPMKVTPSRHDPEPDAFGVLMPMRIETRSSQPQT